MCLGVGLFGFIFLGIPCASWTWMSVSFAKLGKFSDIISSSRFSVPFSLSLFSSSGTLVIQMLVCLTQRSLKLSHCLKFFFLFTVLIRWFSLFCLPDCWSVLHPLICYWFILVYFSFQLLYPSVLIGSFLYFLSLCWNSHWVHPLFSRVSGHLYDYYFELFILSIAYICLI